MTINDTLTFLTTAEVTAITPQTPSGLTPVGATPTYTWTGTQPASITALFLVVQKTSGGNTNCVFGWIVPAGTNSFTHPANTPLPALGGGESYSWTMGYFKSNDGTIRDRGGDGQVSPATGFVR